MKAFPSLSDFAWDDWGFHDASQDLDVTTFPSTTPVPKLSLS